MTLLCRLNAVNTRRVQSHLKLFFSSILQKLSSFHKDLEIFFSFGGIGVFFFFFFFWGGGGGGGWGGGGGGGGMGWLMTSLLRPHDVTTTFIGLSPGGKLLFPSYC